MNKPLKLATVMMASTIGPVSGDLNGSFGDRTARNYQNNIFGD